MARHFVHRMLFAYVLASAFLGYFHKSAHAEIVYDPWNYTQNYIRTLRWSILIFGPACKSDYGKFWVATRAERWIW